MEAIQSWVEDRVGQAAEAEAALASEYAARIETLEKVRCTGGGRGGWAGLRAV